MRLNGGEHLPLMGLARKIALDDQVVGEGVVIGSGERTVTRVRNRMRRRREPVGQIGRARSGGFLRTCRAETHDHSSGHRSSKKSSPLHIAVPLSSKYFITGEYTLVF